MIPLAFIPEAISLATKLYDAISKGIAAAKQKGELTPEKEAEFQSQLDSVFSKDYAQPRDSSPAASSSKATSDDSEDSTGT